MTKRGMTACMGVICGALLFADAAAAAETNVKIAVVRIQDAFNECKYAKDQKESIEKEFKADEKVIKDLEITLRQKMEELRADALGDEENDLGKFKKRQEIEALRFTIEMQKKELNRNIERSMVVYWTALYDDFQRAVAEVAKREGYDLVLRAPSSHALEAGSSMGIQNEIGMKVVHYAAGKVDITDKVLAEMDRIYRDRGVGAP